MTTNSDEFALEWSEDLCEAIIEQAEEDEVAPEVAFYAALAAAVVVGRSCGMKDDVVREQFERVLTVDFPEAMLKGS